MPKEILKELTASEPNPEELSEIEKELKKIEGKPLKNYIFDLAKKDKIEISDLVGLYLADLPDKIKFNSLEEDTILFNRIKNGDDPVEARDALLYSVTSMVISEAFKREGKKVDVLDLIQDANLAILDRAIPKYDPTKGKFSTYAMWWIRSTQRRALNKGRADKVPEADLIVARRLQKTRYQFLTENEVFPDTEKLSEITGLKPKNVERLIDLSKRKLLYLSDRASMTAEGETEIGETIEDGAAIYGERLDDYTDFKIWAEKVAEEIRSFPPRDAKILQLRLGIDENGNWSNSPLTLLEVGRELGGITRERTRQIQKRALSRFGNIEIRQILMKLLN